MKINQNENPLKKHVPINFKPIAAATAVQMHLLFLIISMASSQCGQVQYSQVFARPIRIKHKQLIEFSTKY